LATLGQGTRCTSFRDNVLKAPRKGLRIPNTDPAPFVLCEFCKSIQTDGNAPQEPEKKVYRNSEVRGSGVRCAEGAVDLAWEPLIGVKILIH
jgi:hypothetical protein